MNKPLSLDRIDKLKLMDGQGDSLSIHDTMTEIYLHCPNGYARSAISSIHLEKQIGKEYFCTVRNWNTLSAVLKMFSQHETSLETVAEGVHDIAARGDELTSKSGTMKRKGEAAPLVIKKRRKLQAPLLSPKEE